ncbi:hypothetical protein SAMN04488092_10567 [Thalassovita taeanensis]|uniref:HEPN domain-containing protein n=2 Tax=Thalassovita taeanensis TaxID=657014 RepID=A0A1H9EIT6_9RHOB|nr:hypothetical protein SAMN04488092_10567 [Thalassovita taeanensis]
MRYRLHHQFFWSAQQALEKYLKCAHLLNLGPVSEFSHGLLDIFEKVQRFSGKLIPDLFIPPSYFPKIPVRNDFEEYSKFVERISDYGSPDIRYRHYSIAPLGFDLHKLDELCFLLRRVCMPLEIVQKVSGKSYRTLLLESPNWQPHPTMKCLKPYSSKPSLEVLYNFKWRNFSFHEDFALEEREIHTGQSAQNSEIYLTIEQLPNSEAQAALEWLLSSVRLHKEDRKVIRQALSSQKQ